MERTEKRYFQLECPLENVSTLLASFDPNDYFQISLYERPGIHYFIFTRDAEMVIARGYARVNHFPYAIMTRDEFLKINPDSGHYIQKGLPALSPWPGKLIPGQAR